MISYGAMSNILFWAKLGQSIVLQPSEFTMSFSFCHHGAAINENHNSKILLTLFFMLMKRIKCKGKRLNHNNDKMNTQLYRIKHYSSFFSFLEQNCSAFTIEILIIVKKNAFLFSFLFLFFLYATITLVYVMIEIFQKIQLISLFFFDDWHHLYYVF